MARVLCQSLGEQVDSPDGLETVRVRSLEPAQRRLLNLGSPEMDSKMKMTFAGQADLKSEKPNIFTCTHKCRALILSINGTRGARM